MNQKDARRLVFSVTAALLNDRQSDWLVEDDRGEMYSEADMVRIDNARVRLVAELRRRAEGCR